MTTLTLTLTLSQVFFYQSELPYDAAPPAWLHAGYSS